MAPSRAVLLHLSLPPWTSEAHVQRQWQRVIGPALDTIFASGNPVGLVLSGRLAELAPPDQQGRIEALRLAVASGRVELVATALHEPLLGSIPEHDAIDQLQSHATLLHHLFGARPEGGWLPHGSWDGRVPYLFQRAGLRWTSVPRATLDELGCPRAPVLSVERHGKTIAVLPSVPLTPRSWTGLAMLELRTPHDVRVFAAALPRTNALPSQLAGSTRARAYLAADPTWERLLLAEPAADRLHKRMLAVSRMVRRVSEGVAQTKHTEGGPDPRQLEQIRRYLHRAQAGAALVPGRLVATYRDRAWRDLIRAERVALQALPLALPWVRDVDEDCDGVAEVRLLTASWAVTVAPARQGALTELTHRPSATNLVSSAVPMAFVERWNEGEPVALDWQLVAFEKHAASARVITTAESRLNDVPVQVLKRVSVGPKGPATVQLEVRSQGGGAGRARLGTELFLALGGPHLDGDEDCSLSVEVAGGKEPVDEAMKLPGLEAVGFCGWRSRVDFSFDPPAQVELEPIGQGAARVVFSWAVEVLTTDVQKHEITLIIREVVHG